MLDLVYINLIIVLLDILVVILVYLNRLGISHPMQTFSYALKLKLEFSVLNQLMAVAARGIQRTNFEERRYHHGSAADAFSAECRQFDKKTPDPFSLEVQASDEKEHVPSHSKSIQIKVPSPTLAKYNEYSTRRYEDTDTSSQEIHSKPDIPSELDNKAHVSNQVKSLQRSPDADPRSFLDVDDPEADAMHHKASEVYSGDTLHSPVLEDGERSPRLYPRQVRNATGQLLQPAHKPAASRNTPTSGNRRESVQRGRIKRRVPKRGRDTYDDGEEEEIGVHMWENQGGSLMMEIPWFQPKAKS